MSIGLYSGDTKLNIRPRMIVLFKKTRRGINKYFSQPWSSIQRFGENRLLRSSFVWIAIVPVAAMAFSEVDRIMLPMLGNGFSLNLRLPFSWILFYLAACSFSVAGGIYSILCPPIVREYRNFADFAAEGRNAGYLHEAFIHALAYQDRHALPELGGKKFEQLLEMDYEDLQVVRFNYEFLEPPPRVHAEEESESNAFLEVLGDNSIQRLAKSFMTSPLNFKPEKIRDAFWHVRNMSDSTFKKWRWFCVISYSTGFVALFIVLLQNFNFVVSSWWNG